MTYPEKEIRELCKQYPNDKELLPILAEKFGWTIQQAYIATEQFRRPKYNYN